MKRMIPVLALVAACGGGDAVEEPAAEAPPVEDVSACKADALLPSIGQDVSTVQAQLPEGARVIPPDSVVTQDYRPGRVNVDIDAGGLITRIWCG